MDPELGPSTSKSHRQKGCSVPGQAMDLNGTGDDMAMKRQAQIFAHSLEVCCPYCGEPQPAPSNGSDSWLIEEVALHIGPKTCVSCDKDFQLNIQTKVNVVRN